MRETSDMASVSIEERSSTDEGDQMRALTHAPIVGDVPTIEGARAGWLHEKRTRSGSVKTVRAYVDAFDSYRTTCQRAGLDVDASDTRKLALVLQGWASSPRTRDGRPVTASTANQRRACISSFYAYARRIGLTMRGDSARLVENPAPLVVGKPVQSYAYACPLEGRTIAARLAEIDCTTLAGLRDYALLLLGVQTGRRVAELAALAYGDLHRQGRRYIVAWRHCKGGKVMYDELPPKVTDTLWRWLNAAYSDDLNTLASEAPVFTSLAHNGTRGHQLTPQAVANICQKRLGTSKVHTLRHTFSLAMIQAGARIDELQARLGHANVATTSRYVHSLQAEQNPYADALAAIFLGE